MDFRFSIGGRKIKNITYTRFFRSVLRPSYEFLRGWKTLGYLRELEQNQWRRTVELQEIQWRKLKRLLEHAYNGVPYYRQRFLETGLHPGGIKTPDDFREIPFLTKADIRESGGLLIADGYKDENVVKVETSGSTGEPVRLFWTCDTNNRKMAARIRSDRWMGWDLGEKVAYIWAPIQRQDKFPGLRNFFADRIYYRRKIINCFEMEEPSVTQQLKKYRARFIIAYVTPLYHLARYINHVGATSGRDGIYPQGIITSGEMLYPHRRELIESVFNCKVFNRYGAVEVMLIAAECDRHEGMHLNIDNLYIEFLKNNEPVSAGETGEIVITDLHNFHMPLIRYKIGDVGRPSDRKCSCGRGLPLMKEVDGRTIDMLVTSNGKHISGIFLIRLMRKFPGVRQFQIIQETAEKLQIKIVTDEGFTDNTKEWIRVEVEKIFGEAWVDIILVDEISLASGKYRLAISHVPIEFGNNS